MTAHAPTSVSAETQPSTKTVFRTILVAGMALTAGIWLTSRLDQRAAHSFPGRLQARMVTLTAEGPARLQQISVRPGQRVAAGTPLFVLESERRPAEIASIKQEAAWKEQEALRVKAAADLEIQWRRRELHAEIFQTQLRLASLRQEKLHREVEQVAYHEQISVKSLFQTDVQPSPYFRFISDVPEEVTANRMQAILKEDAAAAMALALASQIALCEARLEELRALDKILESQIQLSHGVDLAEEQRRAAAALLETAAEDAESSTTVTSPSYGLIGVFRKQPGDLVQAGDVVVQILDDDCRSIEVEVPSWAVGNFTPGKQIRLEFPGSEQRTGVIAAIPPQTSNLRGDLSADASVTLVLEPTGKLWPLVPIGSRVLISQP